MGELKQQPKPAEHGRFLQKDSVEGEQVQFVGNSTYGTASFTISAAGSATNLDFGTIGIGFSYTIDGVTWPWNSIVAWNYANFYIDGMGIGPGFESNLYRIGTNTSGTTAPLRKPMLIDIYGQPLNSNDIGVAPYNTSSSYIIYYCQNFDSSSHVIGVSSRWKYIVTGGPNG